MTDMAVNDDDDKLTCEWCGEEIDTATEPPQYAGGDYYHLDCADGARDELRALEAPEIAREIADRELKRVLAEPKARELLDGARAYRRELERDDVLDDVADLVRRAKEVT